MKNARIHGQDTDMIVSAEDVLNGKVGRLHDFVDVEYDFRVTFVKAAKNNGGPYFRLYYSLNDYEKMSCDKKERYEILKNMRHYQESQWHKKWEENVSSFAQIEKCIKNNKLNRYKRSDAFIEKYKLCVEFQHSYIAKDFEDRNDFYNQLGYKVIWLYDLTNHDAKINLQGYVEILEDNTRGFFRIAEEERDLSQFPVFIQVRNGSIYKVTKLFRKTISGDKESTIRYFEQDAVFSEHEFIDALRNNDTALYNNRKGIGSIDDLWNSDCSRIIFENIETGKQIIICNQHGLPNRAFDTNCITYRFVTFLSDKSYMLNSNKYYYLSHRDANKKIWKVLSYMREK